MEKKKHYRGGCAHCPNTEDNLTLDTVLYFGFGGYAVYKNGKHYYSGDPQGEWESFRKLKDIEEEAKKDPMAKWEVKLDNPLRGAIWTRHEDPEQNVEWMLSETNLGFA